MKIIFLFKLLIFCVITVGCDSDFEELNEHPFNPTQASLPPLFNGMLASLPKSGIEQGVLDYEHMGYVSQVVNHHKPSGHRVTDAAGSLWSNYYQYLADARLFDSLVTENENNKKLNMSFVVAQKDIIHALKTFKMIDTFGDIPYYTGGKAAETTTGYYPAYNDQKRIYIDLMNRLEKAEAALKEPRGKDAFRVGGYDVLLGDDMDRWRKFGNSIRLRQALRAYEAEKSLASHVSAILGNNLPVIEDGEDVVIDPLKMKDIDLWNRLWAYHHGKVRFGKTMFDQMSEGGLSERDIFDPRLKLFAEPNSEGEWDPMPFFNAFDEVGNPNHQDRPENPSRAGTYFYSPVNFWLVAGRHSVPEEIITAAEVHFLKAEAYAKGIGIARDLTKAQEAYEAGIRSSIKYWFDVAKASSNSNTRYAWEDVPNTPDKSEVDDLLQHPKVRWKDAQALKLIYTQKWIALYRQIPQAWSLYRQTGMTPHQKSTAFVFNRLPYPISERTNNAENYRKQATKMGGDTQQKKIWWMVSNQ